MKAGFLGLPWFIWGIGALGIALIFVWVIPKGAAVQALTGIEYMIVRWFHSLCWVFLAANFFLRGLDRADIAGIFATLGGLSYLIYMVLFINI